MLVREELEKNEWKTLSPLASHADRSRGRARPEEECDIRTCYMRDRDRIVHCKAFRRLKDKTQVFLSPKGDHYRTRMLHTLEVSQTARTVAKCLRLNEDLVEAIALGHDLGHTPYGHAGERALNSVCPLGFVHSEQSVRVAEVLEKNGRGLNLTWEVLDGMRNHGLSRHPATLEGQVVRLCDKISYIHHDMDDAIRGGILKESDVPEHIASVVGHTLGQRLDRFIHDIITTSKGKPVIAMSEEIEKAFHELREFMFESVYTNPLAKAEESRAEKMVEVLYEYYMNHLDALPELQKKMIDEGTSRDRAVCDYISSMTDRYAIKMFESIYIPRTWDVF